MAARNGAQFGGWDFICCDIGRDQAWIVNLVQDCRASGDFRVMQYCSFYFCIFNANPVYLYLAVIATMMNQFAMAVYPAQVTGAVKCSISAKTDQAQKLAVSAPAGSNTRPTAFGHQ